MSAGQLRVTAILLFAGAAVLAGIGNKTDQSWFGAAAFGLFALGALCLARWRAALHARVLDFEEKTAPVKQAGAEDEQ